MFTTASIGPQGNTRGPAGTWGARNLVDFVRAPLTYLERITKAHGDVVPFKVAGKNWLLLNHPDAIEAMFVQHANVMGRDEYADVLKRALGEGLLTSDGEVWKRQRKLAATAFTPKRIKGYAQAMAEITEKGLSRWKGEGIVNLHEELSHLTMEVVADVLFGASVDQRDVNTVRETMEVFNDFFAQSPEAILGLPAWMPTRRNHAMNQACKNIDGLVFRIIDARRAESDPEQRNDLLGALLSAKDDQGRGMDDQELRDESMTLFLAGHETTALALTHTLYLLARHPEAERRLLDELSEVVGDRLPTADDVPRLVYADRVIKESMRLYPPAWMVGREAKADVEIGGYPIAKGTQVIVSQWVAHRDPRWYRDPEAFDPDRFAPEEVKKRPRFSYFPFGGGPRVCVGNHFAMLEAVLMLALIVSRFHVELLPHTELRFSPSVTLRPSGKGLSARLVKRQEGSRAPTSHATATP